jgi:hypothetical protein
MKGMIMSEQAPEVTYYDKDGNQLDVQPPAEQLPPIELISQSVVIVDQRFVDCPEAVATIQV